MDNNAIHINFALIGYFIAQERESFALCLQLYDHRYFSMVPMIFNVVYYRVMSSHVWLCTTDLIPGTTKVV